MPRVSAVLRVDVEGVRRVAARLGVAREVVQAALGKALYAEGREVIEEANLEVPRETGALAASRFVTPPIRSTGEIKVTCGFGTDRVINPKTGKSTSQYAIYVHERLDLKHPRGGKAKFLEDPANRARDRLEVNLAQRVIQIVGR